MVWTAGRDSRVRIPVAIDVVLAITVYALTLVIAMRAGRYANVTPSSAIAGFRCLSAIALRPMARWGPSMVAAFSLVYHCGHPREEPLSGSSSALAAYTARHPIRPRTRWTPRSSSTVRSSWRG